VKLFLSDHLIEFYTQLVKYIKKRHVGETCVQVI